LASRTALSVKSFSVPRVRCKEAGSVTMAGSIPGASSTPRSENLAMASSNAGPMSGTQRKCEGLADRVAESTMSSIRVRALSTDRDEAPVMRTVLLPEPLRGKTTLMPTVVCRWRLSGGCGGGGGGECGCCNSGGACVCVRVHAVAYVASGVYGGWVRVCARACASAKEEIECLWQR
jgi:hypothetical protein